MIKLANVSSPYMILSTFRIKFIFFFSLLIHHMVIPNGRLLKKNPQIACMSSVYGHNHISYANTNHFVHFSWKNRHATSNLNQTSKPLLHLLVNWIVDLWLHSVAMLLMEGWSFGKLGSNNWFAKKCLLGQKKHVSFILWWLIIDVWRFPWPRNDKS